LAGTAVPKAFIKLSEGVIGTKNSVNYLRQAGNYRICRVGTYKT